MSTIFTFFEFVDSKKRNETKHLEIVSKILKKHGFKISEHFVSFEDDAYLFVYAPEPNIPFGIRIYNLDDNVLAYRVQRGETTQPFGSSYQLNIPKMYNDMYSEDEDEDEDEESENGAGEETGDEDKEEESNSKSKKVAKKISAAIDYEIRQFFASSRKAMKSGNNPTASDGPLGSVAITGGTGTDYANMIH